jgi:hypothetical protein
MNNYILWYPASPYLVSSLGSEVGHTGIHGNGFKSLLLVHVYIYRNWTELIITEQWKNSIPAMPHTSSDM